MKEEPRSETALSGPSTPARILAVVAAHPFEGGAPYAVDASAMLVGTFGALGLLRALYGSPPLVLGKADLSPSRVRRPCLRVPLFSLLAAT